MFKGIIASVGLTLLLVAVPSTASAAKAKKKAVKPLELMLDLEGVTKDSKAPEIKKLVRAVKKVKGVTFAKVDKAKSQIVVRHHVKATPEMIKAAITKAGFKLVVKEPKGVDEGDDEAGDDMGMGEDDEAGG